MSLLTFKVKIAHLLMKDNNGNDKKPNEPHGNLPHNEIK